MNKPIDRDSWETPLKLFSWLDKRFNFNYDGAASHENHLLPGYATKERSLLAMKCDERTRIFCNPPYSKSREFAEHLYNQWLRHSAQSMLLLPVRADRLWWNVLRTTKGVRTEFYTGRLYFSGSRKGAFMYNCNFIFGFEDVPLVDPIDAGQFNENGKGSAQS